MDAFSVDGVRRLEEQGVTDVIVGFRWPYTTEADTQPLADKIGALNTFAEKIIAKVAELTEPADRICSTTKWSGPMADRTTARELARRSQSAVHRKDREAWLGPVRARRGRGRSDRAVAPGSSGRRSPRARGDRGLLRHR